MKQATAEVIVAEGVEHTAGVDIPTAQSVIYTEDVRAAVVAKYRELADRLERRELNGASVQWNDNPDQPAMVVVEAFPVVDGKRTTRLTRSTFARPEERLRSVGGA